MTGSSVAYHLTAHPGFDGDVLVVEADPTYAKAATTLSAGSIRQQFSTAVNVAVSLHGIAFLRAIGDHLAVDGERPDIGLHEGGYLFLATPPGRAVLAANHALQTSLGADIVWLVGDALRARFPWLTVDDVAAGCWGRTGEGWFDGYGLMTAFKRAATALGATYRTGRVAHLTRTADGAVTGAVLDDGTEIAAGTVVIAAGAGARDLAASAGVVLPVHMGRRQVFAFTCPTPLAGFPLLVDPSGVWCRPEGPGFICGLSPAAREDPDAPDDFTVERAFFDEQIWPALAARVPAFDQVRVTHSWAGHYDMNHFDHNVLLGSVPAVPGLLVASGFSGHGLQQSPAVGRGLAELIVDGRYTTLDLSPLAYERFLRDEPLVERNVV